MRVVFPVDYLLLYMKPVVKFVNNVKHRLTLVQRYTNADTEI